MIQTRTEVRCDGCGTTVLGDLDHHANREFNALAAARAEGWKRTWVGVSLRDLCPRCHDRDSQPDRSVRALQRRRPR